jgi:arginase
LSERYGDDLAVLWVDALPDVMGPAQFQNAHAHVLAMLMGEGDSDFVAAVTRPLAPHRILYVGLTETTPFETDFIEKHELAHLGPEELAASSEPVLDWLRATGAKRVAVHFDVDVLRPAHYDLWKLVQPYHGAPLSRRPQDSAPPHGQCGIGAGWHPKAILREGNGRKPSRRKMTPGEENGN